ncbi:MAG: hypothetical protein ACI31G_02170 [Bacilli bacterium]
MFYKKIFVLLSTLLVFSSCSKVNDSISIESSEEQSGEISSETNLSEESEEETSQEPLKNIDVDLKNTMSGADVSQSSAALSFVEESFNYSELITFSSFTYTKTYCDNGGLKLGSSSASGTFTFTSSNEIKSMIISGRPYAKFNSYDNVLNVDQDALIGVNGTYSSVCDTVTSENDSFDFSFENINDSNISISSSNIADGNARFTIFSIRIIF